MHTSQDGSMPMFSVIVTNYNYSQFLRQSIESVLSQDYPNVEIIVVDDGSTDDSRSVIESFGSSVVPVFKENGGVISSCNVGWRHAQGEMIVILDADDFLLPGALSIHAKALSGEGVVRSQGYQMIVESTGKPTGRLYPSRRPQDAGLREIVLTFGPGGYFSTASSGNAWSRALFEKVFPLPESRLVYQDALLFDSAPLYGETVTTEIAVAAYRFHGASLTQSKTSFNLRSISTVLEAHDFRSKRLQKSAEALGLKPQPARWRARNWRIATLRYLRARLKHTGDAPQFYEHLATARSCRSRGKGIIVFVAILFIRLAPIAKSLSIASRIMNLKEM